MGLNNGGLRSGGLRNLSSIAPANFDVAISSTNSEIQPGDTLIVDYSADNTGGVSDTQEIRLEIDSVEEDSQAGVFLAGGDTTTGSLEWITDSNTTKQDYTATVLSDDDTATQTVTVESAIPDSAVSRYTFDDADTSGSTAIDVWNDNDATINGATTGSNGANQTYTTNESYSFDGSDDYVNTGLQPAFGTSGFSVALWIYLDSKGQDRAFMSNYDGSDGFILQHDSSNSALRWFVNGNPDIQISALQTGAWHHLVATASTSSAALFVDGVEEGSALRSGDVTATEPINIGRRPDDSGYTDGRIDDPRIYDKSLSEAQVDNLYQTGSIDG